MTATAGGATTITVGGATWTVNALEGGKPVVLTCNFLMSCAGYYRYSSGYLPDFPGIDNLGVRVGAIGALHWLPLHVVVLPVDTTTPR